MGGLGRAMHISGDSCWWLTWSRQRWQEVVRVRSWICFEDGTVRFPDGQHEVGGRAFGLSK